MKRDCPYQGLSLKECVSLKKFHNYFLKEELNEREILFSIIIILLFSSLCGASVVYYDIDFSSPEHIIGSTPAVGDSITRPSRIYGSPIVSESLGSLNDQPLVFNTAGNLPIYFYDQIKLYLYKLQPSYFISFDLLLQNLENSMNHFVMLFDTPTVRRIEFKNDGYIYTLKKMPAGYWQEGPIAPFTENSILHFEINIDITKQLWTITENGTQIHEGLFKPDRDIEGIRFSLGLDSDSAINDVSTYVGLDNIIVANGPIPEPATVLLLGLGGLFLRRRK